MAVTWVVRQGWGALPPEKPLTRWNPDSLIGVGVHWFGSPDGVTDHARCDDLVRSVQRNHQAGEFTDIAYNHIVCRHGFVFEGRGFDFQTGANGFADVNRTFGAVCYMMGKRNPASFFTPEGKAALAEVIAKWRSLGTGTAVKRHGFWTGSECPGVTVGVWVDAKGFETGGGDPVDLIPDWLDEWLYWRLIQDADPEKRPASVPAMIPTEAWEFASSAHRIATHYGLGEGEEEWIAWRFAGSDPATRPQVPTVIPARWWDDLKFVEEMRNLGP